MLEELSKQDRMRLMQHLCYVAWADGEVQDDERLAIMRLVNEFELDTDEANQVEAWLAKTPEAAPDPAEIAPEHRQMFVDAARELIMADGRIAPEEREKLNVFKLLVEWAAYGDSPAG